MNKWKISFLVLIIINVFFIIFVATSLLIPSKKPNEEVKMDKNGEDVSIPFLISTEKKSLTDLINHYLEEETDQKNLQYRVELEENVNVYGVIKAFNKDIDMTLILEPKVKSDGNMQLIVKELSIGRLKLPISYVLKYMNTNYDLPSYVVIDSSKKEIDINLDELTLKNDLSARAESFNLKKDDITFTLFVPLP
ncbi:YpmS family protein [Metabacillus bambusae]|uniref:YpmS family protein n=1 Tax=Metabacillus bambusae TaxID=2795218 RepID=A0ABS3N1U6_9BACI|nr:YpmS family protein [Metabacillus bambusae]MBO1512223.1 YpmS family protein [Metabacillus bambusae]